MPEKNAAPQSAPTWAPHATVFVSSFCIMVIEVVAGRIVSRHLGASLYTWTSVIGVVLAGIAVGNFIGGIHADRRGARRTLATLFVFSSATCVGITTLNHQVGDWVFLWTMPWALRVGLHVAIVFLLPSVALGTISPVAAKMAIERSKHTGRTIGRVYAWGVVGSLAGTFAAGFWLIATFGTQAVLWAVAGVLAATALVYGAKSVHARAWAAAFLILVVFATGPWAWTKSLGERLALRDEIGDTVIWNDESQYSRIQVRRAPGEGDRRILLLDKLVHGSILMEQPYELQYGYERIYGAITQSFAGERDSLNTLQIGGGGYVFPRWVQHFFPASRTEVIEIDPAVTRAAVMAFGLPENHGFLVAHEDGRAYVQGLRERGRRGDASAPYDIIYNDVFNDYTVPYQLTTVDYFHELNALLSDEGLFLMNLIDIYEIGAFLGSIISTMEEVFDQVVVLSEGRPAAEEASRRKTYILVGLKRARDFSPIVAAYDPRIGLSKLSASEMEFLRDAAGNRILTDDWAPVENLLAPVELRGSRELAVTMLVTRARQHLVGQEPARADRLAARATRLDPDSGPAHDIRARALLALGDHALALRELRELTRLLPDNPDIWYRLGVFLVQRNQRPEAIEAFERAVGIRADHPQALAALHQLRPPAPGE